MTTRARTWLTITAVCFAPFSFSPLSFAQEPEVEVERVRIMPSEEDTSRGANTMIDLRVSLPNVVGLGDAAQVTSLKDDLGNNWLQEDADLSEIHGFDPASTGYFLRHHIIVNGEEGWLRVPVYAPEVPVSEASVATLALNLELLLHDGSRHVTVDNIDFRDIPGWGVDIDVDGQTVTCRDDRRNRPEDKPLELYCFMREGVLLGINTPSDTGNHEFTHADSNLLVEGARDGVTLDIEFPVTRTINFPVTLEFDWDDSQSP
ncbi:hypothetical protein [Vreelandella zhaodongensis]|uniref:hypothetical protein n=1 Tax=Vreelandella zhaodongensis TaxID=1176240 RepID=UPI003EB7E147